MALILAAPTVLVTIGCNTQVFETMVLAAGLENYFP